MQSGDPQTPQGPSDPNQHLGTGPQGLPPSPAERPPVLFIGHGSPMNAIEDNQWSRGLRTLAGALPRPRAILAISAHWYVDGTLLTVDAAPRTIHDFGGFPRALYEIRYPAPGAPDLAARVRRLVTATADAPPGAWGLDHGTWSVLRWLYPQADVPVVQLSLDRRLSPAAHHELGRALADLRGDGVMILGSGNITHNLRDAITRMQSGDHQTPAWARRFDLEVARALDQRDPNALIALGPSADGRLAHPTPDHWLPLLYAQAAADRDEPITYPLTGFDLGSLSMRAVRFG